MRNHNGEPDQPTRSASTVAGIPTTRRVVTHPSLKRAEQRIGPRPLRPSRQASARRLLRMSTMRERYGEIADAAAGEQLGTAAQLSPIPTALPMSSFDSVIRRLIARFALNRFHNAKLIRWLSGVKDVLDDDAVD